MQWALTGRWITIAMILVGATALAAAVSLSRKVAPHPDSRLVRITTAPPGCEITVVPLDSVTGDPLPDRLQKADGLSPVEMHLVPGDYLVVAVQSETVFNEVTRHVPPPSETIGYAGNHTSWRMKNGKLELPPIDVRPFAPRLPMVSVAETTGLLVSPPHAPPDYGERIRVPPFLVATTFVDRATWMRNNGDTEDSPRVKKFLFNLTLAWEIVEAGGMRLPSAAEYSALLAQQSELEAAGVVGLGDDVVEWTSSRLGAHGTGQPHAATVNERTDQVVVMGAGAEFVQNTAGEQVLRPEVQTRHQRRADLNAAWRPVRSAKPRVRAEDFAQSVPVIPRSVAGKR